MTDRELLEMAKDALCDFDYDKRIRAIAAISVRLARPEQEATVKQSLIVEPMEKTDD